MSAVIVVCLRNLQENRHGTMLDQLVQQGHDVSLTHCLNQCVGCRRGPALSIDGAWIGAADEAALQNEVDARLLK
ncbi:DUF1450 domain-containing protein [Paenibacillus lignilyticus]|uniref:DUF1450 domain-containing protein n=1 Tax=Paenibacillus lignilyticus TaxID=1172615 RepID=A0ABS5CD89_9BACL|nr:DUF1450 domain-containing protein [Paenibacillus lignilyticus]MBP3963888.1 DUF1450 domain-containing protein [Paenibacillus lignilyticus]